MSRKCEEPSSNPQNFCDNTRPYFHDAAVRWETKGGTSDIHGLASLVYAEADGLVSDNVENNSQHLRLSSGPCMSTVACFHSPPLPVLIHKKLLCAKAFGSTGNSSVLENTEANFGGDMKVKK